MVVEDVVPLYIQIIAKFVGAVSAKGSISSWLAPLPNTSCTAADPISLIDMSGVSAGMFASVEK